MDLTDSQEDRLSLGIDRFLGGDSITYHGVALYISGKHTLHIDSFSDWEPERTSEAHAQSQIARSKSVLNDLSSKNKGFMAAIGHLRHEFTVCHDYGMGSIALAKEIDGVFQWVYRSEA